jgi:hypothetical protein
MKKILRSTVIAAASVASFFPIPNGKSDASKQKKQRTSAHARRGAQAPPPGGSTGSGGLDGNVPPKPANEPDCEALLCKVARTPAPAPTPAPKAADRYPWKREIVTTTFWIGEKPGKNNPVPNRASSWDERWAAHYGGTDTPDRSDRTDDFRPADFVPGQNPFYVALPYNDMQKGGHKPEAEKVIPWFKDDYEGPTQSVCKGRWLAIRFKDRTVYAQWEDCGPFRTDHSAYVFGDERPKKNLNKGAGLDVSPAVRDFLGMEDTDVTDWKFVDFEEVPEGPWAKYGENNTFVINRREALRVAALEAKRPARE